MRRQIQQLAYIGIDDTPLFLSVTSELYQVSAKVKEPSINTFPPHSGLQHWSEHPLNQGFRLIHTLIMVPGT